MSSLCALPTLISDSNIVLTVLAGGCGVRVSVSCLPVDLLRRHRQLGLPSAGLDKVQGSALLLCTASAAVAGLCSHVSMEYGQVAALSDQQL